MAARVRSAHRLRQKDRRGATVQPEIEVENIDAFVAGHCDVDTNDPAITQCGPSPYRFHCRVDSGLRNGRTPVDPVALVLAFRRNVLIGKAEVANFAVRHHGEVQARVADDPEQFFDDNLRAGLKQCFGRLQVGGVSADHYPASTAVRLFRHDLQHHRKRSICLDEIARPIRPNCAPESSRAAPTRQARLVVEIFE